MSDEVASVALSTGQKTVEVMLELIKMMAPLAKSMLEEIYHKSVDGINFIGGKIADARAGGTVTNKELVVEAQKAKSPISTTSNFLARDSEMIAAKAKKYKIPVVIVGNGDKRTLEFLDRDKGIVNYTEMQALATGDPRIKEKIELDTDVARLKMLESEHNNEQYRLDDTISQAKIAIKNYEHAINCAKNDLEFAKQNVLPEGEFKVEIGGKVYDDRKEAGTALRQAAVSFIANGNGTIHHPIGTFRGFELAIEKCVDVVGSTYAQIAVRNEITYTTNIDLSGDIGNTTRLDNLVNDGIGKKLADMEKKCD